jgi:hypothetical protein
MNSRNIADSPITGSEKFPGSLLKPQFENICLEESIHDLLIEYYMDTYVDSTFRKPFTEDTPNSVIVLNKANQYGRCQIGAEIFGSIISSRHIKNSFILAKFINRDGNSVDIYPGQIQYFFEHSIYLSSQNLVHTFALLDGIKPPVHRQFDTILVSMKFAMSNCGKIVFIQLAEIL